MYQNTCHFWMKTMFRLFEIINTPKLSHCLATPPYQAANFQAPATTPPASVDFYWSK